MDKTSVVLAALVGRAVVSIAPCWSYSTDWGIWGVCVVLVCGAVLLAVRFLLKKPYQFHLLLRFRPWQSAELNKNPVVDSKLQGAESLR